MHEIYVETSHMCKESVIFFLVFSPINTFRHKMVLFQFPLLFLFLFCLPLLLLLLFYVIPELILVVSFQFKVTAFFEMLFFFRVYGRSWKKKYTRHSKYPCRNKTQHASRYTHYFGAHHFSLVHLAMWLFALNLIENAVHAGFRRYCLLFFLLHSHIVHFQFLL